MLLDVLDRGHEPKGNKLRNQVIKLLLLLYLPATCSVVGGAMRIFISRAWHF